MSPGQPAWQQRTTWPPCLAESSPQPRACLPQCSRDQLLPEMKQPVRHPFAGTKATASIVCQQAAIVKVKYVEIHRRLDGHPSTATRSPSSSALPAPLGSAMPPACTPPASSLSRQLERSGGAEPPLRPVPSHAGSTLQSGCPGATALLPISTPLGGQEGRAAPHHAAASLRSQELDTYQVEVLLGVQVLHCEEERERERETRRLSRVTQTETCFCRRPPHQEAFRFPQEPQHQAGVPTPSDLSILICFGVVYCLLGHTASTSGRTLRRT